MKGCCIAIALPFLLAIFAFVFTLIFGIGQPFSELLAKAGSEAGNAFMWTVVLEVLAGIFLAITYPAWQTGKHIYDLFFG